MDYLGNEVAHSGRRHYTSSPRTKSGEQASGLRGGESRPNHIHEKHRLRQAHDRHKKGKYSISLRKVSLSPVFELNQSEYASVSCPYRHHGFQKLRT